MMRVSKALQQFAEESKGGDSYWVESQKLSFAMALERQRLAQGLSYVELARKLGTSPAYISKVFRGDANLTIDSMVKFARGLGASLEIGLIDNSVAVETPATANHYAWTDNFSIAVTANQEPWWHSEESIGDIRLAPASRQEAIYG